MGKDHTHPMELLRGRVGVKTAPLGGRKRSRPAVKDPMLRGAHNAVPEQGCGAEKRLVQPRCVT